MGLVHPASIAAAKSRRGEVAVVTCSISMPAELLVHLREESARRNLSTSKLVTLILLTWQDRLKRRQGLLPRHGSLAEEDQVAEEA